jgi:hypothetical protein
LHCISRDEGDDRDILTAQIIPGRRSLPHPKRHSTAAVVCALLVDQIRSVEAP